MNGEKLLFLISNTDDDLIKEMQDQQDSIITPKTNKKRLVPILGVCAALLALCIGLGIWIGFPRKSHTGTTSKESSSHSVKEQLNYPVTVNGLSYHHADANDRIRYNIPESDSQEIITKENLGELIGEVTNCTDSNLVGKKLYHYSKYPAFLSVGVLDFDGEYQIYCSYGYQVDIPEGALSNPIFDTFQLPNNASKIEVYNAEEKLTKTITNTDDIAIIISLLRDCENIGFSETNRRLAAVWYDKYGNDDVFFDEEEGVLSYRDIKLTENSSSASTDPNTPSTGAENDRSILYDGQPLEDVADDLWKQGSYQLIIETKEGFRLIININQVSRTYSAQNGSFDLAADKVETLLNTIQ